MSEEKKVNFEPLQDSVVKVPKKRVVRPKITEQEKEDKKIQEDLRKKEFEELCLKHEDFKKLIVNVRDNLKKDYNVFLKAIECIELHCDTYNMFDKDECVRLFLDTGLLNEFFNECKSKK